MQNSHTILGMMFSPLNSVKPQTVKMSIHRLNRETVVMLVYPKASPGEMQSFSVACWGVTIGNAAHLTWTGWLCVARVLDLLHSSEISWRVAVVERRFSRKRDFSRSYLDIAILLGYSRRLFGGFVCEVRTVVTDCPKGCFGCLSESGAAPF